MDFSLKTGEPRRQRTECAILPVFDDGVLSDGARLLAELAVRRLARG